MAETKSSGSWSFGGLDGMAAKLQAKAEEVLQSTGSTASNETTEDGAAPTAGSKREALMNMANIVKEHAGKGLDSSKEYLSQVVEKVSSYATDASSTASQQFADAKDKGVATANVHYANVKENLNKAIAKGQAQATSTASADEGTTEREMPAEEEQSLNFPYNVIAWFVSLCHGKLGSSSSGTTTSESEPTSTSKEYSVESLQNAANALTETFSEGIHSARAGGEKAVADATEKKGEVESST
ncbi:unnamed protein product [Calypogeia fissa]